MLLSFISIAVRNMRGRKLIYVMIDGRIRIF